MQKRGQFYLIAAVVIIGMLIGLTTVYNVTRTATEDVAVYDLSSEINFEGSQVVAHGIYNELDDNEIIENLRILIEHEAATNPDSEFIGIYGDQESLTLIIYSPSELGEITIDVGGSGTSIIPTGVSEIIESNIPRTSGPILIELGEQEYNFDLNPDQTLFIIVERERGEERFVATPSTTPGPHYSPTIE